MADVDWDEFFNNEPSQEARAARIPKTLSPALLNGYIRNYALWVTVQDGPTKLERY
jgi:hypothetical protein